MAEADEPFHVDPTCCTACGVPESIAPDLFGWTEQGGCRIVRQPVSDDELGRMFEVLECQEFDCITYRGRDAAILRRMAEAGLIYHAEHPGDFRSRRMMRDRVSFAWAPRRARAPSAGEVAGAFRAYLRSEKGYLVWPGIPPLTRTVRLSWFGWRFHAVSFEAGSEAGTFVAILPPGEPGHAVGRMVEAWLHKCDAGPVRWYTASEWAEGGAGTAYRM
ncbi:ferredoxin [Sphingomonas sp. LB-2]|uniref:ferredoxin n=1 Tax=Sphingomonas caeni TaxID=2984949 RepID=UPI00222F1B25|nr:ferredoxin [Sphingomonas caeni]MCW3848558.1 ferredoxin [Sphingomonas caeni]